MTSIPELDKVIKISELFGVSTDYFLKDDAVFGSIEQANLYLNDVKKYGTRITFAILACVVAPVILPIAGFVGMILTIRMAAVVVLLESVGKLEKYKDLSRFNFYRNFLVYFKCST